MQKEEEIQRVLTAVNRCYLYRRSSKSEKLLPSHEASDYYYAGLKDVPDIIYSERKKYHQNFKMKLLDPNGLPIVIVTACRQSFVLLLEDSSNDEDQYAEGVDIMCGKLLESHDLSEKLKSIVTLFF